MPVTAQYPVPIPTPFQPISSGGNPYINQQTQPIGPAVPQNAVPVGNDSGTIGFSNNTRVPISSTQNLPASLPGIQGPVQQPQASDGFNEQAYRDRGWNNVNAMRADYNATGGPSDGGGATRDLSQFTPTTYNNPYTGQPGTTTQQNPVAPTKEQMLQGAYPTTDIGSFDLGADDFMSEIQSQYAARNEYLTKAEQAIREGNPEILEGIAADLKAGKAQAGTAKGKVAGELQGSVSEATGRKEDALASARRLYDELRRGGVQRFGGATSAGDAMNTLLGVEQQKQAGQTQRDFGQTMATIEREKANVESQYQDQLLQLEADNKNSVNQANQEFRSRLDDINQNRLLASDAKSQARLGVLQDLRNKAFQIQAQNQQFRQQLEAQKQQQQMDLDAYAQKLQMSGGVGQQATQTFGQDTTTSPTSNITATGQQSSRPVGITQSVGQIGDLDERTNFLQGAVSDKDLPQWMQR